MSGPVHGVLWRRTMARDIARIESACTPLVVERQGRTDCRECVYACPQEFMESSRDYQRRWTEWKCLDTQSWISGTGPEYCGDFVEAVL